MWVVGVDAGPERLPSCLMPTSSVRAVVHSGVLLDQFFPAPDRPSGCDLAICRAASRHMAAEAVARPARGSRRRPRHAVDGADGYYFVRVKTECHLPQHAQLLAASRGNGRDRDQRADARQGRRRAGSQASVAERDRGPSPRDSKPPFIQVAITVERRSQDCAAGEIPRSITSTPSAGQGGDQSCDTHRFRTHAGPRWPAPSRWPRSGYRG